MIANLDTPLCDICNTQISDVDFEAQAFHVELFGDAQHGDDQAWVCLFCKTCKEQHPVTEGGAA